MVEECSILPIMLNEIIEDRVPQFVNAPSLVKYGNFAFVTCEFRSLQSLGAYSELGYFITCYLGTMLPCLLWRERNRWWLCESSVICCDVKTKTFCRLLALVD
ncbi:hypothetical protein E2542_SST22168 [Spatholobus suberectus]|nr:hypothetical protein E2542_SST22168 [Spatholobus suberectus]